MVLNHKTFNLEDHFEFLVCADFVVYIDYLYEIGTDWKSFMVFDLKNINFMVSTNLNNIFNTIYMFITQG